MSTPANEQEKEVIIAQHPSKMNLPAKPAGNASTEGEAPNTETPAGEQTQQPAAVDEDAITLKYLNKKGNTNFATIAEYEASLVAPKEKTKEEFEKEAEDFKNEAFTWKLTNDKTFKEKYEKKTKDSDKSSREIALHLFTQDELAENPQADLTDIEERFKDFYHEEAPEESALRKKSLKLQEKLAENYRKENYGDVDGYEDEYKKVKDFQGKVDTYVATAKETINNFPKTITFDVPVKNAKGEDTTIAIPYEVSEEDLKMLHKDFHHANSKTADKKFLSMEADQKNISKEDMAAEVKSHLLAKNFDKILAHSIKVANEKFLLDAKFLVAGGGFNTNIIAGQNPDGRTITIAKHPRQVRSN